ncbi:MAG: 16S rRNA (guanine(527)-N(7))-methyltransferase RsmG [Spirochaetes bacterium GWF1_31_7]|nr:MAG: 16S rRNA (guanine(527)-N(7))-methyltransferase RsmG [Spirochaetes bacterium GWE1_32_154]OHD46129.1 MAG: 16S rRNA (guanine(527)-N(7))-methyltransferase RsmG [Spirochaetes bacterium GWE2_31_10]OHD47528.1 MAG: 16S rRNA (guanine(527)-N(7))-methyltransferase RsmG [Spirochaetes bacterium GWF1_31_7]OHD83219.1 MAG: 16S rRNA (guanine(527)-N(7))-methyltransferase RsmG [Spirochaetes bacterium RIFOXYB1_FULL_32_8]
MKTLIEKAGIDTKKTKKIAQFIDFLLVKNSELNLISRKLEVNTILLEHIYDCLAGFNYFKGYKSITDLGSGGGFPGLLLGIVFSESTIHLVEKSPKKAKYLYDAVNHLKLTNVTVNNGLVNEFIVKTDVITCRGFKPINEIIDMTQLYFNSDVTYILFKGRVETINEELGLTAKKYSIHSEIFKIADQMPEKERNIVILKKS